MTRQNKQNCKCQACWKDFHEDNEQDNVTCCKKIIINVPTENSFCSLDDDNEFEASSKSVDLNRSCLGPRSCLDRA